MKYNAVYGQSGGPTSVINSSLYGVIKECMKQNDKIDTLFMMRNGVKGLIEDNLKDVKEVPSEQIELLPYTPSAILGSLRYKLKDYKVDETDYLKIVETLKKHNIRYIFFNGGNDSMDTCAKLASYLKHINFPCYVIGIPKTIDNDLALTDHTPGYGSAAKFICQSVKSIIYDNNCYPKGRVNIVEIMGRDTGWLTASSALASSDESQGPDLIYVPEVAFNLEDFKKDVLEIYNQNKRCLVAVSEGIRDKDGHFISENASKDAFGHAQLGGVGQYLANYVTNELGISTRAIELSLLQRCFAISASITDRNEAIKAGQYAVKSALRGKTNKMVIFVRKSSSPYKLRYSLASVQKCANAISYLKPEMINEKGNNITEEFINYCKPLVKGKTSFKEKDGLPVYADKKYF